MILIIISFSSVRDSAIMMVSATKGMVSDTLAAVFIIENAILVKEIKEYGGCNTFVPVTETVVLGDEVKKVGCFFFEGKHPRRRNSDRYYRCCP